MAVKKYDATEEELSYMDFANAVQAKKDEETPWYKSWPAAAARGVAEGVVGIGQTASGLLSGPQDRRADKEARTALYDEYLPVNSGAISSGIEKAGNLFPLVAAGGGGLGGAALKSAAGGASGEIAKQLGFGELGQSIAEIPALIGPDLARLVPTAGRQTELAQAARRMGMTEEQLSLTLGGRGVVRDLATDVASKGGRTVRAFDDTRAALGRVWDTLRTSPEAQQVMTGQQSSRLINAISHRLSRLPAEARTRIQGDFNDLLASPMRGDDVINFWQDLNYYIQRGERGVGVLKQDLQAALQDLSPALGNDFRITNELYGNYANLAERMGPDIAEHLIRKGEQGIAISAITTGNYPVLKKLLGPVGARLVAREMVINPRLQNLSSRMYIGMRRGLPSVAKKAYDELLVELGKTNSDAAQAISGFDFDEFINSLPTEASQ